MLRKAACLAGLISVLLAGCSTQPGSDLADGLGGAGSSGAPPEGSETPLQAWFAEHGGAPPGLEESEQAQRQTRVEQLVEACMREQGFEYIPRQLLTDRADRGPSEAWDLPDDEFTDRYGYGISTSLTAQDGTGAVEPLTDPNDELLASMSQAEQQAWWDALIGPRLQAADDNESGAPVEDIAPYHDDGDQGCYRRANEEVDGQAGGAAPTLTGFEGLFEEMAALERRLEADARVVAAMEKWSDCMAAAGHPGLTHTGDAPERIEQRYQAIENDTASEPGAARITDLEAFRELQSDELQLARDDRACQQEHLPIVGQLRTEFEQEFLDRHRTELDRLRAALEVSQAGER